MGAFMFEVFAGFYLLVIILVLLPTFGEFMKKKSGIKMKVTSFLACVLWPITLVTIFVAARGQRRSEYEH